MGCSISKLDDEEAVQLCKDRKKFIKEAVEHRMHFASGHLAYIESLKRVSAALHDYMEGDEPHEFLLDSFITPPFTPIKKTSPGFITISSKSFSTPPLQSKSKSSLKVNYLRPSGNPAVFVEERPPQSPETFRVETYSPVHQYSSYDGFFAMQNPASSSAFFSYSPDNRLNLPPPSPQPQTSQWDFFWNPFSSLDYYSYPNGSSFDHEIVDDDITGLRQVREEEGIPDLEEETETDGDDNDECECDGVDDDDVKDADIREEKTKTDFMNNAREEVTIEDADDEDDDTDHEDDKHEDEGEEPDNGHETGHEEKGLLQTRSNGCMKISKAQNGGQIEASNKEMVFNTEETAEETPGFTVYLNRRPTSMAEVVKDIEDQFMIICKAANEISVMLEANRAQYSSTSNELTAMKVLNPVAFLRSASSRSSSSRYLINTPRLKDEGYESSSDFSEEFSMSSGSHQSTLDRLYVWEKKLYQEVRSGERVRLAYEKKCMQLRSQDVKGEDPYVVDKTRAALRDLHTQIKVSIHSVEAVSKRIEALRDEELQPQLLELVQGMAKMWKVMAESHQSQKRTLDEAKNLLANSMPSKLAGANKCITISSGEPHRIARSVANLETQLRNWRACFESWIASQRSYVHALTGWLLRCVQSDPVTSKLPFSPRRCAETPLIFGICIQWSRFLDDVLENSVLDGLETFAAYLSSLYAQQMREDSRRGGATGSKRFSSTYTEGGLEVVEFERVESDASPNKVAEIAMKVLRAGMSVAVSSLTDFAVDSAKGYTKIVDQWDKKKHPP